MPYAVTDDGVKLYCEETGTGTAVIFVHEFAGDYRSWEPQVRHFGRRYRVITFNARGYPPPMCRRRFPPIPRIAPPMTYSRCSIISA